MTAYPIIRSIARTGKPIILSTGMSDFEEMLDGMTAQVRAESSSLKELRASVAPINGYGSYLPDEIIARSDLSAEAKVLCHELDKYRNCDPQSERYLQCNPGHFTLQPMKRRKIGLSRAHICRIILIVRGRRNIKGPSSSEENHNSTRTRRS